MIIKNPLNKKQVIRVNSYDNDIIIPNSLSETKQFTDMPKVSQLTQNSWNFSPYTRVDNYNDVEVTNLKPIGRIERYNGINPNKYHDR